MFLDIQRVRKISSYIRNIFLIFWMWVDVDRIRRIVLDKTETKSNERREKKKEKN